MGTAIIELHEAFVELLRAIKISSPNDWRGQEMTTGQISRAGEEIFEREILSHFEYMKIPTFSDDRVYQILQLIGCDYLISHPTFLSIELKTRISQLWG